MLNAEPPSTYHDVVMAELKRAGFDGAQLYRRLDELGYVDLFEKRLSDSTVRSWISNWRFPRTVVPFLARIFPKLPATPEQVARQWPGTPWPTEKKTLRANAKAKPRPAAPPQPTGEFGVALAKIDKRVAKAREELAAAASLVPQLFAGMGADHFFVSTTRNVWPYVFYPTDNNPTWDARADAISRGAVAAMIVPDRDYTARLRRSLGSVENDDLNFVSGFDSMRQRLAQRLRRKRRKSEADARRCVDRQVGLFEWHEFPYTPAEMTVSLFGQRRHAEAPAMRLLTRGALGDREGLHLWPPSQGLLLEGFRRFVRRVIDQAQPSAGNGAWKPDPEDQRIFVRTFLNRMASLPDDAPHDEPGGPQDEG